MNWNNFLYLQVWSAFGCRTLKDYLELYLRSDVCQLADVFQNYRVNCKKYYALDPAYFVSAPQLTWNAMFKKLDLRLELISDSEIYRLIQPHIRGGICHASVRHAQANNIYMGSLYNPNKTESFIMYIDANNLYGWAMSQPLPYSDYKYVSDAELAEIQDALTTNDPIAVTNFLDVPKRCLETPSHAPFDKLTKFT